MVAETGRATAPPVHLVIAACMSRSARRRSAGLANVVLCPSTLMLVTPLASAVSNASLRALSVARSAMLGSVLAGCYGWNMGFPRGGNILQVLRIVPGVPGWNSVFRCVLCVLACSRCSRCSTFGTRTKKPRGCRGFVWGLAGRVGDKPLPLQFVPPRLASKPAPAIPPVCPFLCGGFCCE